MAKLDRDRGKQTHRRGGDTDQRGAEVRIMALLVPQHAVSR